MVKPLLKMGFTIIEDTEYNNCYKNVIIYKNNKIVGKHSSFYGYMEDALENIDNELFGTDEYSD